MITLHGGFFWMQTKAPVQIKAKDVLLEGCVFCGRPIWYQVRRWYRAVKLWLNLPYEV